MIEVKNPPNKEQKEVLSILQEECAEVIVAISKINRFGLNSYHPNTPKQNNKQHLEEEIGDLLAMIKILVDKSYVDLSSIDRAVKYKMKKLEMYSNIDLKGIEL